MDKYTPLSISIVNHQATNILLHRHTHTHTHTHTYIYIYIYVSLCLCIIRDNIDSELMAFGDSVTPTHTHTHTHIFIVPNLWTIMNSPFF